ncbi:transcriptional regulator, TetR family [Agromyces sp. CF514]|uniref:TetR/AcrR family transcriptional regulator n=1 Tax=Agromyces sp. CF514 TaxID=1881031 RepID=UPI0008DFDA2B|nr:TetR/AcrR family transcriptional regulator [Agromyces sp. CF514]SFR72642.1 transcriptional regulator, TetR family [Agromyces sp. CF514]
MPKVTDEYRAARRDEIIEAALRSFAERGIQRTSMADVIEASGLSAGAIYGHFAGKKELFAAVAERVLGTRTAELEALGEGGAIPSPGELMASLLGGMSREPFADVVVQLWGDAAIDPEIRSMVQSVFAKLRGLLESGVLAWAQANPDRIEGDPTEWAKRAAPVVLGFGPGFLLQRALIDDFDGDAYIAMLPQLLPR